MVGCIVAIGVVVTVFVAKLVSGIFMVGVMVRMGEIEVGFGKHPANKTRVKQIK